MGYKFYNDEYPYKDVVIYDENGQPITPRKARKVITVYAVLCFAAAAVMLTIMLVILHSHNKRYERCSTEVVGTVIDSGRSGKSNDSTGLPVFRYQYNGKVYEQKCYEPAQLSVGDHRTIHLDPNNPTDFYLSNDDSTAISALSLLSAVSAALGVILIIVIKKSKKNEQSGNMK